MVSALFERAGAAREFLSLGDLAGARSALDRVAWMDVWNQAVQQSSVLILAEIRRRLESAAATSGIPHRLVQRVFPTDDDARILAAKLSSAGIPLEDLLAEPEQGRPWADMIRLASNALEASWLELESIAERELHSYTPAIERVAAWRRPTRALWVSTILALSAALYLGLMLGGYLPTPELLAGFKSWWWSLPWP